MTCTRDVNLLVPTCVRVVGLLSDRFFGRKTLVRALVGVSFAAVLSGCSGGMGSYDEVAMRRTYSTELSSEVSVVEAAIAKLHPVCDAGGNKDACSVVSNDGMSALSHMKTVLERAKVPQDYSKAHGDLLAGIDMELNGFRTRNQGITDKDDGKWTEGNRLLAEGLAKMNAALKEYPKV